MAKRKAATPITKRHREQLLEALASTGVVERSIKEIAGGPSRTSWYRLRRNDRDFAIAWDAAIDSYFDGPAVSQVMDIAFHGFVEVKSKRVVMPDGTLVEVERTMLNKQFPTLALRLLERRNSKFRPVQDVNVNEAPPESQLDTSGMTRAQKRELAKLLRMARKSE